MRTRIVVVVGAAITVAMLADVMRLTAPDPNPDPTTAPQHQAGSADSFVQSIGIDTHIKNLRTPYGDYANLVKPALEELGVKHARDAAVQLTNTTVWNRYADLCSTLGIRYTLNVNAEPWPTAPTASQIDQMVSKVGCAIEMFEGPNEYNNHRNDSNWDEELESYQAQLFKSINSSNHASIPLLAAPLGKHDGDYPPASDIPDLSASSDLNSMHSYPGGNPPTFGNPGDPAGYSLLFDRDIPMAEQVGVPGRAIYATETGYTTADGNVNEVSDKAKAKYTVRLAFEYFRATDPETGKVHPIKRGYHYQLLDHLTGTSAQAHFGLIRYDGTKKPSFRALENTIDILEDPGPAFAAGSLAYELSGADENVHQTLLQKRDGTFYLVLWQEVRSYDKKTDQDISVTPQNVTVQFSRAMKTVRVYDPTNIASSGPADDAERHPSRTLSSVRSVTEPIGDQVKIIQVTKP